MNKSKLNKKKIIITKWLDSVVDSNYDPPEYKLNFNKLSLYYNYNDRTLKNNDFGKIYELLDLKHQIKTNKILAVTRYQKEYNKKLIFESRYVQRFIDDNNKVFYQYIDPFTNRYHVNMLFNQLLNYCIMHDLRDHHNQYIINKKMRPKFYEFCFENSK